MKVSRLRPHTSSSRPLPRINFGTFSDEQQTFAKRKKGNEEKKTWSICILNSRTSRTVDGGLGTSACYGPGFLLIIRGKASRRAKKKWKRKKKRKKGKGKTKRQGFGECDTRYVSKSMSAGITESSLLQGWVQFVYYRCIEERGGLDQQWVRRDVLRPYATSVWGLKLLVYEALSY